MSTEASDPLFAMFDAPMEQSGKLLLEVPMFPLLSTVHFIMTAIALRSEPGSVEFANVNPIASCILHVMVAMSGTILSDLMLGRPLLGFLKHEPAVMTGIIVCKGLRSPKIVICVPFIIVAPLTQFILNTLEELRRARNVMIGVNLASAMDEYKDCTLVPAVVGTVKGTGKRWSISVYKVLSSGAAPGFELLNLSFVTKISFILALFYSSQPRYEGTRILIGFIVLFTIKLRDVLTGSPTDFFKEPQAAIWSVLAYNYNQESGEIQRKEVESNEQKEEIKLYEEKEEVLSDEQKEVQSDKQTKEEEEFADESGTEERAGKTAEGLQASVESTRRETDALPVADIAGDSSVSVPDDDGHLDETTG